MDERPFRGLPPLRGGSASSSYAGGKGNVPRPPNVLRKNLITAGVLAVFAGAIYITALKKLSGTSNQLTDLEQLEKETNK